MWYSTRNLGNMIYNGRTTLRLCGFPFAEIRSLQLVSEPYLTKCDTCQKVKAIHLRSAGELQPLPILAWKWEDIIMDFIVGLPKTSKGFDSIWVIVDQLTKSAHFLPVKSIYPTIQYATMYLSRIMSLHGVPKTIVSDQGT